MSEYGYSPPKKRQRIDHIDRKTSGESFQQKCEWLRCCHSDAKETPNNNRRVKQTLGELSLASSAVKAAHLQTAWAARMLIMALKNGQFRFASWLIHTNCSWQNERPPDELSVIQAITESIKSRKWPRHMAPSNSGDGLKDAYLYELHTARHEDDKRGTAQLDCVIALQNKIMNPSCDTRYEWLDRMFRRGVESLQKDRMMVHLQARVYLDAETAQEACRALKEYETFHQLNFHLSAWMQGKGPPLQCRHVLLWFQFIDRCRDPRLPDDIASYIWKWKHWQPNQLPDIPLTIKDTIGEELLPFLVAERHDLMDWLWCVAVVFPDDREMNPVPLWLVKLNDERRHLRKRLVELLLVACPVLSPDVIKVVSWFF